MPFSHDSTTDVAFVTCGYTERNNAILAAKCEAKFA
jgi:hypothetical protein